jgi:hypothetical protein
MANAEKIKRAETKRSRPGKKPVAKLVPVGAPKGKRQPGALKGKLIVGPAFFELLPASEPSGWD